MSGLSPFATNSGRNLNETMREFLGDRDESDNNTLCKREGWNPFPEPPDRYRGGGPAPLSADEKATRFLAKIQRTVPEACWLWRGARFKSGYGMVNLGRLLDGRQITGYAHRVAYELAHGRIPDELLVRHRCDVPLCCNPSHLLVGTVADNVNDARVQGHYNVEHPGRWLLPPRIRRHVLHEALTGPRGTIARLSRVYGVSIPYISAMVRRHRKRADDTAVTVRVKRLA